MSNTDKPFNKAEQVRSVLEASINGQITKPVRSHLAGVFGIDALAGVFGIDAKDDHALQSRLKQTRKLIREIQREVKRIPEIDSGLYVSWVPRALAMFTAPNLDFGWSQNRTLIDSNDLVRVEFCIDALKMRFSEEHIAEEKLAEIRSSIEELKSDILTAGFELEFEEALVDALQALLTAIDEYSLRGVSRLKEGLSIAIGTVIVNFGLLGKPDTSARWQKYSQRFAQVVSGLCTLIQSAIKNKAELQAGWRLVQRLLEGGSPPTPPNDSQ